MTSATTATTTTPIAAQVGEMAAAAQPSELMDAFARNNQTKVDAGISGLAQTGSAFPDGHLLTATGEATTFAAAVAGRPAVVVFYRGAWCPCCNIALRTYEAELAAPLAERGVALVAISPQAPDGSLSTAEKNELSFTVLSDPGNQIARGLEILNVATADELATNAEAGLDLAAVDADGVLRFLDAHVDCTTRTEPAEILAAVAALQG